MELIYNNIIQEIENQVILNPDKPALIFADLEISYSLLNQYCNKIGNYLIYKGLKGSNIGISLKRSPEIIITILGVLKAGCAYVFLDPKYPYERINYIYENSDIKLLITDKSLIGHFNKPEITKTTPESIFGQSFSVDNPRLAVDPNTRAYIMYTSGSTGKPKGVEISHANVVNYINAIKPLYDITKTDVYLHTASFSFSSSIRQFFIPLFCGIPVYIANDDEVVSLHKILDIVRKRNITVVDSTPALWKYGIHQIEKLNILERQQLLASSLRVLIFSGDVLHAKLIQKVKSLFENRLKILNVCGQTESIGMLAYIIPDDFEQNTGFVPIGYPLNNTHHYVLDDELNPVGDGEIGELYITSPSVGLGYYKNPELTAKVFTVNIILKNVVRKTLKTGDLVRYFDNNPIEHIGRTDFQVKIRGIRIDISEVENAILGYPSVNECVVLGELNPDNEQVLICFIVTKDNIHLDINKLKHYLKGLLAESYIPEKILTIKKLPVSSNNKVDRIKLKSIAENVFAPDESLNNLVIKNEIKKTVYNLFANVLNSRGFTISDSFFDIGGHSLKAVELAVTLEKIFNKPVPVELIYKYPSVEKLAPVIENIRSDSHKLNLVAFQTSENSKKFVCVHGDDANFIFPKYFGDDISFYGYFHQGRNGERIKYTEIKTIAKQYIEELFQFLPQGPYFIGGYSIGGIIAFEMCRQITAMGHEVKLLILIDSESPQHQGKRIRGYNTFNNIVDKTITSNVLPHTKKGLTNRLYSAVNGKFIKYGYYMALAFLCFGFKVPISIRNYYIMGVYRRARSKYYPELIDVKTILFRSTDDNFEDRELGWDRYIKGNINIYEIKSDHHNIIKEPQTNFLAKTIREVITAI
jgi:amino acid adenylation domain-containing protein